jgi:hypothetical protein
LAKGRLALLVFPEAAVSTVEKIADVVFNWEVKSQVPSIVLEKLEKKPYFLPRLWKLHEKHLDESHYQQQ